MKDTYLDPQLGKTDKNYPVRDTSYNIFHKSIYLKKGLEM